MSNAVSIMSTSQLNASVNSISLAAPSSMAVSQILRQGDWWLLWSVYRSRLHKNTDCQTSRIGGQRMR